MRTGIDIAISADTVDAESFNRDVIPMLRGHQIEEVQIGAREGFGANHPSRMILR